ncbi:hypothetical protein JZ751_014280 [Albula glossodonta]|uniref:Uncharacterized protein n=1 Tax=Albula glossodonta TaxID=121402 RepID=A0A8T2NSW8_9TELE|nr:hypothetical protein JZ751_014280 [Albula glossodonta]
MKRSIRPLSIPKLLVLTSPSDLSAHSKGVSFGHRNDEASALAANITLFWSVWLNWKSGTLETYSKSKCCSSAGAKRCRVGGGERLSLICEQRGADRAREVMEWSVINPSTGPTVSSQSPSEVGRDGGGGRLQRALCAWIHFQRQTRARSPLKHVCKAARATNIQRNVQLFSSRRGEGEREKEREREFIFIRPALHTQETIDHAEDSIVLNVGMIELASLCMLLAALNRIQSTGRTMSTNHHPIRRSIDQSLQPHTGKAHFASETHSIGEMSAVQCVVVVLRNMRMTSLVCTISQNKRPEAGQSTSTDASSGLATPGELGVTSAPIWSCCASSGDRGTVHCPAVDEYQPCPARPCRPVSPTQAPAFILTSLSLGSPVQGRGGRHTCIFIPLQCCPGGKDPAGTVICLSSLVEKREGSVISEPVRKGMVGKLKDKKTSSRQSAACMAPQESPPLCSRKDRILQTHPCQQNHDHPTLKRKGCFLQDNWMAESCTDVLCCVIFVIVILGYIALGTVDQSMFYSRAPHGRPWHVTNGKSNAWHYSVSHTVLGSKGLLRETVMDTAGRTPEGPAVHAAKSTTRNAPPEVLRERRLMSEPTYWLLTLLAPLNDVIPLGVSPPGPPPHWAKHEITHDIILQCTPVQHCCPVSPASPEGLNRRDSSQLGLPVCSLLGTLPDISSLWGRQHFTL